MFVAGQVGVDADGKIVSPHFEPQARQALNNVLLALEAAGASPAAITAITIHLTDMSHLARFRDIKREVLGETAATSTAVQVARLAMAGLLIELTVIAAHGSR